MIPAGKRPPDTELRRMYCVEKLSSVDIARLLGTNPSTVCKWLARAHIERRTPAQGSRDFAWKNAKKRPVRSAEWNANLSTAGLKWGAENAKGTRVTPSGYVEYTRGPHKGRLVHVVLMEEHIGRRLKRHECVHHVDRNRQNNDLTRNLRLMTRAAHAALHRREDGRIEREPR